MNLIIKSAIWQLCPKRRENPPYTKYSGDVSNEVFGFHIT